MDVVRQDPEHRAERGVAEDRGTDDDQVSGLRGGGHPEMVTQRRFGIRRNVGDPDTTRCVPQGVIFDMDGVLLDSEQLWNQSKREVVRERGGHWREDAPTAMIGMSSPE